MKLQDLITFDPLFNKKNIFLISLSALEQHGRFAPIGTDTFIQDVLLKHVEEALPEVIFLPTIPIGTSWQQLGFHGSISLQEQTTYRIILDIVESLKDIASMFIFVSWHGGNKPIISDFIDKEQQNYTTVSLFQLTFGDEGTDKDAEKLLSGPAGDHADNTEISLMLAIRPDLTKQPTLNDSKNSIEFDWSKPIKEVQPTGEIDIHPRWVANAEIGNQLIKIYSQNLINKIRALLTT